MGLFLLLWISGRFEKNLNLPCVEKCYEDCFLTALSSGAFVFLFFLLNMSPRLLKSLKQRHSKTLIMFIDSYFYILSWFIESTQLISVFLLSWTLSVKLLFG